MRIAELEAALLVPLDRTVMSYAAFAERDEARGAVRRLAGALEKQQELYDNKGGVMKSIGLVALADPVVRCIVEGV